MIQYSPWKIRLFTHTKSINISIFGGSQSNADDRVFLVKAGGWPRGLVQTSAASNDPDVDAHVVAAALGLPARFYPTLKPINLDGSRPSRKMEPGKCDVISVVALLSCQVTISTTLPRNLRRERRFRTLLSTVLSPT
jgi:hypothetical protein